MIFVHELGHFLLAKASGIRVNEFALGMGPRIFKFRKKETLYALRLFPIGGFVSMEGEDTDSDDDRAFFKKPVYKRMAVVVAGAFMNILLGFIVLIVMASTETSFASNRIAEIKNNQALTEQINIDDKIDSINGYKINIGDDIRFGISRSDPDGSVTSYDQLTVDMVVIRDGKKIKIDNYNTFYKYTDENGNEVIDYSFRVYSEKKTVFTVVKQAFYNTLSYIKIVWISIGDLLTGRVGMNNLSGVVGVGTEMGKVASMGLQPFLSLVALITINLGVFNLLPFPALDGGRFVFLLIEVIRRKPIKQEIEGYINAVGLALLMILVVYVTVSDVIKLF